MASSSGTSIDAFQVGTGAHFLSGVFAGFPKLWSTLSNLETRVLEDRLDPVSIDRPVYVTGLARAGTTLLLEILASHPEVATHRYRDFPGVLIPFWWNQSRGVTTDEQPSERAHGDRLMVTSESPEAMEEMLWMANWPDLHNPATCQVLDANCSHRSFEQRYRDHIRKILVLRNGTRYVSKGNYNLTRISYLNRLFPEARFVIPVRPPSQHIASLIKQHQLFCNAAKKHPRSVKYLQRVGHFEFGVDVRFINIGDRETVDSIYQLLDEGQQVRGWARYWAMIHHWLLTHLKDHPEVAQQTRLVGYDRLCQRPKAELDSLFDFVQLDGSAATEKWADRISAPSYYQSRFTTQQQAVIVEETGAVASKLGCSASG